MKTALAEQKGIIAQSPALLQKRETVKHDLLTQAGKLLSMGYNEAAQILLGQFTPWDDISTICQKVLNSKNFADNLYLESAEGKDKQINVFDVVLRAVPSVKITTGIALETLLKFFTHHKDEVSLVNIGIGRGLFEAHLVEALSKLPFPPSTVNIVGIDIDQQSIDDAETHIGEAMQKHLPDSKLNYHGVVAFAEKMGPEIDWLVESYQDKCLAVVSAFSLHHIQEDTDRTAVLSQIKSWNPGRVVLVEPDVDHFNPDFNIRLKNCRQHFGKIFEIIDTLLDSEEEKAALKYLFFGREIENILKLDNAVRFEKHETSEVWMKRLVDAGLRAEPFTANMATHDRIQFNAATTGRIQTLSDGIPMVSVLVAK